MVLIEAMTKGVPVVSFDCPRGPAELVVQNRTGLLVADGDVAGMTRALLRLIDDRRLRRQMERRSYRHAAQYTQENIGRQWRDLFDELLRTR
jgi:glycosyltransferase involved in cell wall biosynthesis